MSSIGSIQKRGKNSWFLTVSSASDGSGKRIRHTKTVRVAGDTDNTQRKDAEKQLALFISEIERGQTASSGKMTLAQFYDYWKTHHGSSLEASTQAYNNSIFRRIDEALGRKRIDQIEPRYVQALLKNLAEPGIKKVQRKKDSTEPAFPASLSANTIRKHLALLSSLFSKAVQWNMLPYNPAERVEPPKVDHKPKAICNQDELGIFLQSLEGEELKYRIMVLLALTGGLRREEIFGLLWSNIDFEKNSLHIDQASVYIPGSVVTKGTKNNSSNRVISVPASVLSLLKQHRAEQLAKRLKLGGTKTAGGRWEGAESPDNDQVFTAWNGAAAHPHSFNTWLKRFIEVKNLPHISPHAFRHMSATFLIASGTDIRTVSGKLGHAQTSTTMNIYAHLLKSAERETADKMETFLTATVEKAKQTQEKQAK